MKKQRGTEIHRLEIQKEKRKVTALTQIRHHPVTDQIIIGSLYRLYRTQGCRSFQCFFYCHGKRDHSGISQLLVKVKKGSQLFLH